MNKELTLEESMKIYYDRDKKKKKISNKVINIAPQPYIGQYGPIKNPLFVTFLFLIEIFTDSIIQPAIEYIKNNAIYCSISLIIVSPFIKSILFFKPVPTGKFFYHL